MKLNVPFLTIDRIKILLDVPKSFIYEHTRRGCNDPLPCFKFGKHLRFREDEVIGWIELHRKK